MVSAAFPLDAQTQPRTFAHLTTEEGLSNNVAIDIVQDAQGFIWIATHNGLNRYDGHSVKHFYSDPSDSTSLHFGSFADLHVDRKGHLWGSTHSGVLHRYDPNTESFTRYRMPYDEGGATVIEHMYEGADGTFWLASWHQGLLHFNPASGALTSYRHDPSDPFSLGHNVVKDIIENTDGTLWLATYAGLNLFDPKTGHAIRYPIPVTTPEDPSRRPHVMWDVHRDRWGTIWVGTFGGLYRFVPESQTYVLYPPGPGGPSHYEVHTIHEDHEGYLWIGYVSGLDRFDPRTGTFEAFVHDPFIPHSLPAGSIKPIFQDRAGTLWVGSDRRGVSRTDLVARRIQYNQAYAGNPKGLQSGLVHAILEDPTGSLWLGGEAGLSNLKRSSGHVQHFTPEAHNLPPGTITDVMRDPGGTLWVASDGGGIGRLQASGTFERFTFEGENDNYVNNIISAQQGGLWIAGGRGFFHWVPETGTLKPYRPEPGNPNALEQDFILVLHQEATGTLWAGTANGLSRLDPLSRQITNYIHQPEDSTTIQFGPIHSIHQDPNQAIWVGGPYGLSRFDLRTHRFVRFNASNKALPTDTIFNLLSDEEGKLWLYTDIGILCFDPTTGAVNNYEPNVVDMPANVSWDAAYRNEKGELFFGALDGFYSFVPEELAINAHPPTVALTELRVSDVVVVPEPGGRLSVALPVAERLRLSYQDRIVSLSFAALHFSQPEANTFSFQLQGFDATWRGPTRNTSVTYTNLDPGPYTFRVRAANSDGVWSDREATLQIDIDPPWWDTLWFRMLVGLSVLGSLAGAYSWRVQSIQQQKQVLERQVRERTQEIEAQRTMLELQARKLLATDEMKSNFFANTSHELRTPLTLIRGNLEDIVGDTQLRVNARTWKRLNVAMGQTERLQQLVEQLLDLSRLQSNQMQLQAHYDDVGQFLSRVVNAFQSVAEQQKIGLTYTASLSSMWIYFDHDKLEKVVTNLIGNALKFTPAGGEVHVSVSNAAIGGDGYGTGEFVSIEVADTGEGIDAEALSYIFDRFYQADGSITRTREGMGLGLALAKELTDLHGGEIRSASVVGHGTTFTVLLPKGRAHLAEDEIVMLSSDGGLASYAGVNALVRRAPTVPEAMASTDEEMNTVLVVEDNTELRDYIATHLRASYAVLEAEDGEVGFHLAEQHRPDLIVSDVMMPKRDGFSLLRAIKEDPDLATIPVVLLTAKATEADQREGLEAEAAHYIAKPFKMPDLKLRIQNLLTDRARVKAALNQSSADVPGQHLETVDATFLAQAQAYVEAHLQDKAFNVGSLAQALLVSESTLRRRLQDLTGLSAAAYIRQIRLTYAKGCLEQQAYKTIAEVAAAVGFSNPHYFTRLFKQTYDLSPSDLLHSS